MLRSVANSTSPVHTAQAHTGTHTGTHTNRPSQREQKSSIRPSRRIENRQVKRAIEVVYLALKLLTCIVVLGAAAWTLFTFWFSATSWPGNVTIETQVLPYHGDLRIVVVRVKAKNPRLAVFRLESRRHDTYVLQVRKIAESAKVGAVFDEDTGNLIADIDLLTRAGGDYAFAPGAEMNDMEAFVLPLGTTVSIKAEMQSHAGLRDARGKPDGDLNGASTIVRVAP